MDQLPDITAFAGTDLGLELQRAENEFWASTSLAGLQYYTYGLRDRD